MSGNYVSIAEALEAGFRSGLFDREYSGPMMPRSVIGHFYRGERVGAETRALVGGRLPAILRETEQRQKVAQDTFAATKRFHRLRGLLPPREEPCARCEWIGLCAVTGRTCPMFRRFTTHAPTGEPKAQIPDKEWGDSWLSGRPASAA